MKIQQNQISSTNQSYKKTYLKIGIINLNNPNVRIKSVLALLIIITNFVSLSSSATITTSSNTIINNSNNYPQPNSNINSSQLAKLLNIPVDQLNILLQQQIKPIVQSQLTSSSSPNINTNSSSTPTAKNQSQTLVNTSNNQITSNDKSSISISILPSQLSSDITNQTNSSTSISSLKLAQTSISTLLATSLLSTSTVITASNSTSSTSSISSSSTITNNNFNNCSSINEYWTGFRCACRVGYCYKNGNCQMIMYQSQIIFPSSFNYNYYYSGVPTANQNNINSSSLFTTLSTTNSTVSKSQVINSTNIANNKSINFQPPAIVTIQSPKLPIICGINQIDNGLGTCICKSGYFRFDQKNGSYKCFKVQLTALPSCYGYFYYLYVANMTDFSVSNITCQCYQGSAYTYNNSTICSKCPVDSLWSTQTNSCFVYCGANMKYNQSSQKCQCFVGYGQIKSDQCQICQQVGMIFMNGYCVKCPIGSVPNFISQTCDCPYGYQQNDQGICIKTCPNNQILYFDTYSNQSYCSCVDGLGISNSTGQCGLCPANTYPSIGLNVCIFCSTNQILINGKQCQCIKGYARNMYSQCVSCSSLNNSLTKTTFLLTDGNCAYCPGNQTYINNTCTCQANYKNVGYYCIPIICPLYEQLSTNINGGCQCVKFYSRNNMTQICQLSCPADEQKAGNFCIKCNLNQIYLSNVGCICSQGFAKNSSGVCQIIQATLTPNSISNTSSQTIAIQNTRTNNLNNTPNSSNSSTNLNANSNNPNISSNNPIVISTNSKQNLTQTNKTTTNSSSSNTISFNPNLNSTTNTSNLASQTNLTLLLMNFNINNVYFQLQIPFNISFSTQEQMQNFMLSSFPDFGTSPASVFCSQTLDNLTIFECLLIYPSGIPNKIFSCNFYYNYKGMHGNSTFTINTLSSLKIQNSLSSTASRLR